MNYQPKTGARCTCRPGVHRDNCPTCEGTGWVIDFRAIRARNAARREAQGLLSENSPIGVSRWRDSAHRISDRIRPFALYYPPK